MLERVIAFLSENTRRKDVVITGDSSILYDLGFSSFELIDMCRRIENELDLMIRDKNLSKIETVNDIVKYLEEV